MESAGPADQVINPVTVQCTGRLCPLRRGHAVRQHTQCAGTVPADAQQQPQIVLFPLQAGAQAHPVPGDALRQQPGKPGMGLELVPADPQGQADRHREPAAMQPVPIIGETELALLVLTQVAHQPLAVPHPAAARFSHLPLSDWLAFRNVTSMPSASTLR